MNKRWSFASKESILASDLLDEEWKQELSDNIYDLLKALLNNQKFHRVEPWISRLMAIIHNIATSVCNWRSVGEEEMSIAKVDYRLSAFPSLLKLCLFSCCFDFKIYLENNSETLFLLWSLIKLGYVINFLVKRGSTYHSPIMHLMGLKKVYYPRIPPGKLTSSPLEKIFLIYFVTKEVQNVVNGFRAFKRVFFGKRKLNNNQFKFLNCPLCLNERNETICTPCGHLFCLECLVEWMRVRSECPLCRTRCPINACTPLLNF